MEKKIGKYEIIRLLGKGNMGEVYLALDPVLDRRVAIKTIRGGNDFEGDGKARFEREARAMAALNHTNIITVYDFGSVDDSCYLVMEFLEGDDLATLIQRGTHSKRDLLEAVAQACDGLGFAHSRGIVHRDVKPANIIVVHGGKAPVAKLLDFGVASVDRSSLTEQGVWMGTISYMAPEYLEKGQTSPSADLFAVGVIIYEILSGERKPFPGETPTAILSAILCKPPEKLEPADLVGVPPAVLAVLDKALAKDPAKRYRTAEELGAALREALKAVPDLVPNLPPVRPPEPPRADAPQRIVVGKGGGATCLSLRVALRQAASGAVIVVLPGVYKESLQVNLDLTLMGEGNPGDIVVEPSSGSCILVDTPRCVIRGLTFQGKGSSPAVDLRSGHAAMEDCAVSGDKGLALRLRSGAELTAVDSQFQDGPAGAVELGSGSASHFLRCAFHRSRFAGVLALEGARTTLEDCMLSGHEGAGVHAAREAKVRMTSCRVSDNPGLGISVVDGASAILETCELSSCGQPGMLLHRGGASRLSHCRILNGRSLGIACHLNANVALDHCLIQGNAEGGILLGPGAETPVLGEGNDLVDPVMN